MNQRHWGMIRSLVLASIAFVFPLSGNTAQAVTEDFKLTASDSAAGDQFGNSVSIDGGTAIIGAFKEGGSSLFGSAYIFVSSGGTWVQQAKLTASDAGASDEFGASVSISGDTVIVGSYSGDASHRGSAYIYTRSGGVWTEEAKLIPNDSPGVNLFGGSVSISGDTAVIGAHFDDDNGLFSGSAYVFVRSGGIWSQQAKIFASDAASGAYFGNSVAVSGDTAIIGAVGDNFPSGSAYIFVRNGGTWSQQAKLVGSNPYYMPASFGASVSVSDDTALIGSYLDNDAGPFAGSAYVFVRNGTSWTEEAKLTASDAVGGGVFGWSVSLEVDTALIGALPSGNGIYSGSGYIFTRCNSVWTEQSKLISSDWVVDDNFGVGVAISGDSFIIGASKDDDGAITADSGSAYLFTTPLAFKRIMAFPHFAEVGQTTTIAFRATESLLSNPLVTVNGNVANYSNVDCLTYEYTYTVTGADTLGAATIEITGQDTSGNNGTASNNTSLVLVAAGAVPLSAWPAIMALTVAGVIALRRKKPGAQVSPHA